MRRRVGWALALLDTVCMVGALAVAWIVWLWRSPNLQNLVQVPFTALLTPNPFMPSGLVLLAAWLLALRQLGMHDPGRLENSVRIVSAVTRAAVYLAVFVVVENFVAGERLYARSLVVVFVGCAWLFTASARLLIFRLLLRLEAPPTAVNAVIVGVEQDGAAMAQTMSRDARHVCTVVGHVQTGAETQPVVPAEDILGEIADLPALVNRYDVRVVILATRELPRTEALSLAVQADGMGLRVLQAPYSWGVVSPRLGFARVGGLDFIDLVGIQYPTFGEQVKRAFDLVAVTVGGLLLLPGLLLVALAVKLQDGGPILYRSDRLGRGGRKFGFLKFRSMVVDADELRDTLTPHNEADGPLFKMSHDPRITRLGKFIRKYSIDEFPQLLNVLRGEMNLVGPRPLPARDLDGIEKDAEMRYWFEQRSKVKPGITGLWQVSGRSDLDFPAMVRLDIHYIQDWSPWLDLQILAKTLPAVIRGRGAR